MSEVCRRAIVKGVVQGVGFRAATAREAARIGALRGTVRNLPSGEVEILVQGEEHLVERLLAWARHGPPTAAVTGLEIETLAVVPGLGSFVVQR